jgi:heme-degrading monooxygenase HmoA
MFAVVFEVRPADGKKDDYLALAKHLKPMLESIDGFIDNERFESRQRPGWILSVSTWRDEKSVVRWRTQGEHHRIQETGRDRIFMDYHLRVCEVIEDSNPPDGVPLIEQRLDETQIGVAKALSLVELWPAPGASLAADPDLLHHTGLDVGSSALTDHDVFESIYNAGKTLVLAGWQSADHARAWMPPLPSGAARSRRRVLRNIRDYGMFERREAAQYYPDAATR